MPASQVQRHFRVVRAAALLIALASCSDRGLPTTDAHNGAPTVAATVLNIAPTSGFAIAPRYPAPGDTVTVDGTYSHDADGQIISYRWDFGNGSAQNTTAQARTVFRRAGTYTVRLTTFDDRGDSTTVTLGLVVGSAGAPPTAVSATQSSLTLGTATAAAGTIVNGTLIARNAAGSALPGVPITLSSGGQRVSFTPPNGASGNGGAMSFALSSGVAQTVIVRGVADFTAISATASVTLTPSAVSATRSSFRLTSTQFTTATDTVLAEVIARDTAGNAVSGAIVSITSASGATETLSGITDINGRWIGTVRAPALCNNASAQLTASAASVALSETRIITGSAAPAYGVCGTSLWLDATDTASTTLLAGNALSVWRDRSGRNDHAYDGNSLQSPTVTSAGIYGRRSVRFSTASTMSIAAPLVGIQRAVDVFLVAAPDSTQPAWVFFNVDQAGERFGSHLIWPDGNAYWDFGYCCEPQSRSSAFIGWFSPAFRPSVWAMSSTPVGNTQRQLRRDGLALSVSASTDSLRLAGRALNLGWDWAGMIGEMLIFPRALTPAERQSVERALMIKWGIGTLAVAAGNAQSAGAGTSPAVAPSVRITDDAGIGLPGASVTFQITAGGGRIGNATTYTAVTDALGYATLPTGQWVLDAGNNTLTAWYSPIAGRGRSVVITGTGTLPSGLQARFDASDTTALVLNSSCSGALATTLQTVGCWLDRSGNGYHAIQTIATDRPAWTQAGIGGRPALSFTLARENWLSVSHPTIRALRASSSTIVAAATAGATEDGNTNASSVLAVWQGYHNGLMVYGYPNANQLATEHWARDDGGPRSSTVVSGVQPAVPFVGTAVVDFTTTTSWTSSVYLNGLGSPFDSASDPAPNGASEFVIGQGNAAPIVNYRYRLDGRIGELLLFDRALSVAERRAVERYLGWKWGISVQ